MGLEMDMDGGQVDCSGLGIIFCLCLPGGGDMSQNKFYIYQFCTLPWLFAASSY